MTEAPPKQSARLLFLHAQTGLHPGSGTALGAVDLPVQRERHTRWPTIPGSALKGVLRDLCRERAKLEFQDDDDLTPPEQRRSRRRKANEEHQDLLAAFGPGKIEESSSHAGALSITDARILAFPVRSLRGVFAWVSCPAVLLRLNRDLKVAGLPGLPGFPAHLDENSALCANGSPLRVDGNKIVLEEFEYTCTGGSEIAAWFARHALADEATRQRMLSHLVLLGDDAFSHFVRNATEIVARVGLNYDTKTVKEGALFYQEFLPAETIFYSVVLASASRFERVKRSADEILTYLGNHVPAGTVLQIGGDETTGKGLCLAHLGGA
jgi:CRISPR-associated protein Cmr4